MPNFFNTTDTIVHGFRNDISINGPSQNIQAPLPSVNMVNLLNPQTLETRGYAATAQTLDGAVVNPDRTRSWGIPILVDPETTESDQIFAIAYEVDLHVGLYQANDRVVTRLIGMQGINPPGSTNSGQTNAYRNLPLTTSMSIGSGQIIRTTAKGIFAFAPDPLKDGAPLWIGYAVVNREGDDMIFDLHGHIAVQVVGTGNNIYDPFR